MFSKKIVFTTLLMFIIPALTLGQTIRVGALEYNKTRRPGSESIMDFLITAINHVCEVQRQAGTPLDLLVTSELPTNVGNEDGIMMQEIPGMRSTRLGECAKANNIWLAAGLYERVMEDGAVKRYNALVFFNRDGEMVSKYLKTNVPPEESGHLQIVTGTIPMVVNTEFGKIGALTCWECEKTTNVDSLADKGAWLIVHPTWGYFEDEAIAWCIKRSLYWLMACWDGPSEVFAPDGSILSKVETITTDPNQTFLAVATIPLPEGIESTVYYHISGRVTSKDSAAAGATIHLSGRNCIMTTYTDDSGDYQFKVPAGDYSIRPGSTCFEFTEDNITVSVTNEDVNGIDFAGAKDISQQFTFSGKVTIDDVGVSDVVIGVFGDRVQSVITAADGTYEIGGIYKDTRIIVTPCKEDYIFQPEFFSINQVLSDNTDIIFTSTITTEVRLNRHKTNPPEFRLGQNYPNPFNLSTTINFDLQEFSHQVHLVIFNILGQEIQNFIWKNKSPGSYSLVWDSKSVQGKNVSAGVYFCLLKTDSFQSVNKMVLLP
jgi:hypothetical protein